jgi:hypothetical protein
MVKLAMLIRWCLVPPKAWIALQHLLQQSGGHHLPERTGQKTAEPVVSLNRKGMVRYIRISSLWQEGDDFAKFTQWLFTTIGQSSSPATDIAD